MTIALDVAIIWALAVYREDAVRATRWSGAGEPATGVSPSDLGERSEIAVCESRVGVEGEAAVRAVLVKRVLRRLEGRVGSGQAEGRVVVVVDRLCSLPLCDEVTI